jgi:hypothetical protein
MVMPEEIPKEAIEFITRFGGATASVFEQMLFDWYWQTHPEVHDKFPYTRPIDNLPMWHNIIVGGISIGEALLGLGIEEDPLKVLEGMDYKTKEVAKQFAKGLKQFGEGGILYTVPRLARISILNQIPVAAGGAIGQGESRGQPATPQGRVIKL